MTLKVSQFQIESAAAWLMEAMPDRKDFTQQEVEAALRKYLPALLKEMLRDMPQWMDCPSIRPLAFDKHLPATPSTSEWWGARQMNR